MMVLLDAKHIHQLGPLQWGWIRVAEGQTPARACVEAKLAFTKYIVEVGIIAAR